MKTEEAVTLLTETQKILPQDQTLYAEAIDDCIRTLRENETRNPGEDLDPDIKAYVLAIRKDAEDMHYLTREKAEEMLKTAHGSELNKNGTLTPVINRLLTAVLCRPDGLRLYTDNIRNLALAAEYYDKAMKGIPA